MRRVVVENEVWLRAAVGVSQGTGQLDKELLGAIYVCGRSHHVLERYQAAANSSVQSDSAYELGVMRSPNWCVCGLPSPGGLWPNLEGGLVEVDDVATHALLL